jgi:orotidine 5'-phosphate decarboxylase subfamily 2
MPIPFFERLEERAKEVNSLLCVGLDPHPELLVEKSAEAAFSFCLRIIEQTMDLACAYKPNSAFFEALGPEGMRVLGEVIQAIPTEIPVVLDAKRGDIASTAKAYAEAVFTVLKADAVTVSPYLGWDSLEPMLENPAHGVFMLCKTSNPSAHELQAKIVEGGVPFYVSIAQQAMGWERPGSVGLVVGATDPVALESVRSVVWVHRVVTWKLPFMQVCVRMDMDCSFQFRVGSPRLLIPVVRQFSFGTGSMRFDRR